MMINTMDAYGLGVAATLNASTKMDFQSKNLMMRIDHVDQDSPVQITQHVLYHYNAIRASWFNFALGSYKKVQPILGDPGADRGGEGKSKRAEKYGTKKSKERREEKQKNTKVFWHQSEVRTAATV